MSPVCSAESYPNDRPKLGLVEIINNLDSEQKPTQNDVRELTHAFGWIGMDVNDPNLDLKAKAMIPKLNAILKPDRDLKEYNIFVLAIICHGKDGDKLLSSDGKVVSSVKEIEKQFDEMEAMRGRPKILILESCRGSNYNIGRREMLSATKGAERADVLIAYSTVPDYVSHTQRQGSPFILELTNQIMKLAKRNDLVKILTCVLNNVSGTDIQGMMQMPQFTSTLRKEVWLKMPGKKLGRCQICRTSRQFCLCNFNSGRQNFECRPIGHLQILHQGDEYNLRNNFSSTGRLRFGNLKDVTEEDGIPVFGF